MMGHPYEIGGALRCCIASMHVAEEAAERAGLTMEEGTYVPCLHGCKPPGGGMVLVKSKGNHGTKDGTLVWQAAWVTKGHA